MSESNQAGAICPLCGGDNQCALAAGKPAQSCWCQTVTISAQARAKVAESDAQRCLCAACGAPLPEIPREG